MINSRYFIDRKTIETQLGSEMVGDERRIAREELEESVLKNIHTCLNHFYNSDGNIVYVFTDGSHKVIKTSSSSRFLMGVEAQSLVNGWGIDAHKMREYIFTREREIVNSVDPLLDEPKCVITEEYIYQKTVAEIDRTLCTDRAKEALRSHYGELIKDIGIIMRVSPFISNKKKSQFIVTGKTNTGKTTLLKAFKPLGVAVSINNTKVLTSHDPSPYRASALALKNIIFDDIVPTDDLYNLDGEVTLSPKNKMAETAQIGAMFFTLADIERIGTVDRQQLNRMTVIALSDKTLNQSLAGVPIEESVESLKLLALESYREAYTCYRSISDCNRAIEGIISKYTTKDLANWDDEAREEVIQALLQGTYENAHAVKQGSVIIKDITSVAGRKNGELEFFINRPKQTLYAIFNEVNSDLIPNLKKKTVSYILDLFDTQKTTIRVVRDDGSYYKVNGVRIKIKVEKSVEDNADDFF